MAAYINRTVAFSNPMNASHKVSTDDKISSPLQIFGQAKKQINDIFIDILTYVADASERIRGNCYDIIIRDIKLDVGMFAADKIIFYTRRVLIQ